MKKDTPKDVPACPRGFHWCDKREECIPDGTGAEDKLEKRQQRYFFKEQEETPKPIKGKTDTVPACPKGYKW